MLGRVERGRIQEGGGEEGGRINVGHVLERDQVMTERLAPVDGATSEKKAHQARYQWNTARLPMAMPIKPPRRASSMKTTGAREKSFVNQL